jgi:acid phosphatase type 7
MASPVAAVRALVSASLLAGVFLGALAPTARAAPPNTYIDRVYDADTGDNLIDEDGSGAENVRATFHGDGIATSKIRFRCRVDSQAYVTCTSPWQKAVRVGSHTLIVQAYNVSTGQRDNTPARRDFAMQAQAGPPPPPPPSGGAPVIAAAGDIACDPTSSAFNNGLGTATGCRQKYVSDLLGDADAVLPLGDIQYEDATLAKFWQSYDLSWGRFKSKTRPAPGNHEYLTSGAAGYFDYFGTAAGERGKGYYAHELGTWRLYALNSNISMSAGSAQEQWLRQDLAANPRSCVLAYFHHPRFSAGHYSDSTSTKPLWDALHAHGAELVLNGHDHNYQRYRPMRPDGTADPNGVREIIAGTGGKSHYALRADGRRQAANDTTFGVLKLTLRPDGYDWRFVPEAGATYSDAGSSPCH